MSPFYFSSPLLPTRKAKQLYKAFPFLKLAVAQEVTARALGYASWYACIQNGQTGKPSLPDQDAGLVVRVARYYHQAGVLVGVGIAPCDADIWVRAWGLTGDPTFSPAQAKSTYYHWQEAVNLIETGKISETEIAQKWGGFGYSKYPDIDRPMRVCSGVIVGPYGKYPHYAVNPAILATVPMYLRGPASLVHYEDDGHLLTMNISDFPRERILFGERWHNLNKVQHEWHHGTPHPRSNRPVVPEIEAIAESMPNAMIVISQRAMPIADGEVDFGSFAIACLRGRDFAQFIRSKGVIDPSKVIWYSGITDLNTHEFGSWLDGMDWSEKIPLPVFAGADQLQPCMPIYSYPFKEAPMASDEYSSDTERLMLLPLDQDYGESDDDDDDGGEPPDQPNNSSHSSRHTKIPELESV